MAEGRAVNDDFRANTSATSSISSGLLVDLRSESRSTPPIVSTVQRKKPDDGDDLLLARARPKSTERQSGYVPGSYRQKLQSGNSGGGGYKPGSVTTQKPGWSDVKTKSTSEVSFGTPLYGGEEKEESSVKLLDSFTMPSEVEVESSPPAGAGAAAVANPAAFVNYSQFDNITTLANELSIEDKGSPSKPSKQQDIPPTLPPKEILAQAGIHIDLDRLEPTADGRAPLELVATFLTSVMHKQFEAALILCQHVLRFEPDNETAKEFYPTIIEKIHYGGDSVSEDSSDEEDSSEDDDDDDDEEGDSSETDSSEDDSDSSSDSGDERLIPLEDEPSQ